MEIILNGKTVVVETIEKNSDIEKIDVEILNSLSQKSITEQVELLNYSIEKRIYESEYGIENESVKYYNYLLRDDKDLEIIYTFNNAIVAVKTKVYGRTFTLYLNKKTNVYYASEDDGPYTRSADDYCTLELCS